MANVSRVMYGRYFKCYFATITYNHRPNIYVFCAFVSNNQKPKSIVIYVSGMGGTIK